MFLQLTSKPYPSLLAVIIPLCFLKKKDDIKDYALCIWHYIAITLSLHKK